MQISRLLDVRAGVGKSEATSEALASGRFLKGNFWIPVSQHVNVFFGGRGRIMSGESAFLQVFE